MTIPIELNRPSSAGEVWLHRLGNAIVDLLFPPRCVACQRLGAWLCPQCLGEVEVIRPPLCPRCGLPLDGSLPTAALLCPRCQKQPPQLDGLRAYAFHSGALRQAIHEFKYNDLRGLAAPLGRLMAEGWATLAGQASTAGAVVTDAVVPVPLYPSRQRQRGYNQAALLARELGAHLQRPVVEGSLVRVRATAPQVGLGTLERRANVQDAFRCLDSRLAGKRVLLVDDVCTTGATLESAAGALREAGAVAVYAYTLSRAKPSALELDKTMERRVENGADHQGEEF